MCDKKRAERRRAKEVRARLKSDEKDGQICERFLASSFARKDSFFIYHAIGTEVNTAEIIAFLKGQGKRVCLPVVTGEGRMSAVRFTGELSVGAYGILQPSEGKDEPCQVALIPLLAADRKGNRLGYGGGYYDRYLAVHEDTVRVGVCYFEQIVNEVQTEPWDEPLDFLLTERGIIPCQNEGERAKIRAFYTENLT